jgi:hypothetical protein
MGFITTSGMSDGLVATPSAQVQSVGGSGAGLDNPGFDSPILRASRRRRMLARD